MEDLGTKSGKIVLTIPDWATTVDVFGVPAIGGHPKRTWTRPTDGGNARWLGQQLNAEIPSVRILLYEHPEPGEFDGLEELARYLLETLRLRQLSPLNEQQRPIIFVCHSTGGLVVKKALIIAQKDPLYKRILTRTFGIVFFATPHHGSSILSGAEYQKTISENLSLTWDVPDILRSQLAVYSAELEGMAARFESMASSFRIWSFLETKDTVLEVISNDGTPTEVYLPVVSIKSSVLNVETEEASALDCDHVSVCKFDNATTFNNFVAQLEEAIEEIEAQDLDDFESIFMDVAETVTVEVHQFYADFDDPSQDTTEKPLKIWSVTPKLSDFLENGPARILQRRMAHQGIDGGPSQPVNMTSATSQNIPRAPRISIVSFEDQPSLNSSPKTPGTATSFLYPRRDRNITGEENLAPVIERPRLPRRTSRPPLDSITSQENRLTHEERPPQRAPTYQLPDDTRNKFRWIHVPYTHTGWVREILHAILNENTANGHRHVKSLLSFKLWGSKQNRARHAQPHARFMQPLCKTVHHPSHPDMVRSNSSLNLADQTEKHHFVLYLPYLHWDSYKCLLRRSHTIEKRLRQQRPRPVSRAIAHGKSVECMLIWEYLTANHPIHCRRTLDQYGYPNLRNTHARDSDQIIYKRTNTRWKGILGNMADKAEIESEDEEDEEAYQPKGHSLQARKFKNKNNKPRQSTANESKKSGYRDPKVLMVDQLWLWILNDENVVTFFPPKEQDKDGDHGLYKQADLRSSIYSDINGDLATPIDTPCDFAAMVVQQAVTVLLESNTINKDLQVFRIFEETISYLTELHTISFKEFRDKARAAADDIAVNGHYDNNNDLSALLELRDVEDELSIISKLLKEQQDRVQEMREQFQGLDAHYGRHSKAVDILHDVVETIIGYQNHLQGMMKSAKAAQKAYKDLLDMKQKEANVDEAREARRQAQIASGQSRSVLVFTIFTVIFLPLSFFTSMFGMNAREWNGPSGTEVTLSTIAAYTVSISFAVILIAFLMAFNARMRNFIILKLVVLGRVLKRFFILIATPSGLRRLSRSLAKLFGSDFRRHSRADNLQTRIADLESGSVRRQSTMKSEFSLKST